ncbi:MAG: NUDIX hydrolase [Methanomicrobia archaeon]|nr:NUDIX hydrolase [Methanomicrobia archaeon]MCK4636979.1 NUDIX hydrolase [Methanomicrobia archaeon]
MRNLHDLLKSCAYQAGAQLLEVCQNPYDGFKRVSINLDEEFYGISQKINWYNLNSIPNFTEAREKKYISADFPELFYNRFRRIAPDVCERSKEKGFEFYNGKLAKLKNISITKGKSPIDQILQLTIGYTSYFTAIGTNIHFDGYRYQYCKDRDPESTLPEEFRWPRLGDWRNELSKSPLANDLAVDLILYNDEGILYVERDRVGQQSGKCSSTINGVMEFLKKNPDKSIEDTAKRETRYELGIEIEPKEIKWIGVGATLERCEPFIIGIYKISENREEVAKKALGASEQREVSTHLKCTRKKDIRSIPVYGRRDFPLSFGPKFIKIQKVVSLGKSVDMDLVMKKILRRDKSEVWTDEGATSLLLCLTHLYDTKWLCRTIEDLLNV